MLRNTYKNPSSSQFKKDLALYMGGVFICFIVNGLFVDIGMFNYFFTLMYFLFGIMAATTLKHETREHAVNSFDTAGLHPTLTRAQNFMNARKNPQENIPEETQYLQNFK